ncbi:hypothetical protein BDW59DRAFT_167981 [Aspergillus cavernicola]|uniref:Uncharacterized protein n=1 Tax=Aspergillus cavernicola TaxID=176166 RepID=A0ABR4H864_9EURO
MSHIGGRLYSAPVNPQVVYPCLYRTQRELTLVWEILDAGTGNGVWAIDAAGAKQPSLAPPNCIFEIDDVTLPWAFASNRFDPIYMRDLCGSVPDWDGFLAQYRACLRPGDVIILGNEIVIF